MAATAVYPAMHGEKLFPLFAKANAPNEANDPQPAQEPVLEISGLHGASDEKPAKVTKSRKPRKKQIPGQKTLQEIVNPKTVLDDIEEHAEGGSEPVEAQTEGGSPRRGKRRRTSKTDSVKVGGQDDLDKGAPPPRRSSPQVIIPASSPLPSKPPQKQPQDAGSTTPKKMLRLRAGGKFSSPVSKQPKDDDEPSSEPVKRRGRPRKAREPPPEKHLMAVIPFDIETDIGTRIDRILSGEERYKKQVKIIPKKQSTPRKADRSAAHPFFNLDRRKEQPPPMLQPSPRKVSGVTPGKLRRENMNPSNAPANELPEVWTSALLKDRLMFKHPGAREPAWPDREQTHVRGLSQTEEGPPSDDLSIVLSRRKHKAAKRSLFEADSLLTNFSSQLDVETEGRLREDGFREPHPSLRIPSRLLIHGQELAKRVAIQLSAPLRDADADEILYESASQQPVHPALQATFDKIAGTLSAFDEGRGEAAAWTQKYAPSSLEEVLQPIRQTRVLKNWLLSLKVSNVESALKSDAKQAAKSESKPKKRKRRRKDDDLDDFLVDRDEEVHDMDELTDPEDQPAPSQGRKTLNSIVQVAVDGAKLSNAVLLNGPHGCGKTAAAYAAAKELGFKVFEISSSERRSGKDVLDKVGDMTKNHLVKHHGTDAAELSSSEEPNVRLDEAFQRDLASGRQGKMASFFKPQLKAQPKKKVAQPKETVKNKALDAVQNVLKKAPKDQQQSLILLEEVDILFKEDKDFWTTILKLITTSKRPFIMTCNDEDLVPLQAMSLHAILRFTPPPIELATNYLLLIAAAEGHQVERRAVSSLYRGKEFDLRSTISELDLWCQMGVGDPRGGLSWIFQRYPPGSDLDSQGRRLRVVSEGTYITNMESSGNKSSGIEEKLMWARREHGLDPSAALGWEAFDFGNSAPVKAFSEFADDLSAADVYGQARVSSTLDVTQKPMSDKARLHYIEGLRLLQTDEEADYSRLSSEMLAASTALAFEARNLLTSSEISGKINDLDRRPSEPQYLSRHAFACFDVISAPVESALSTFSGPQQSVFDGPLEPIATDIAPYVRSIVHFDQALAEQREALGGGKSSKRARTTRAARSALEGGQRGSTRRERWFPKELDLESVLATGGSAWPRMLAVAGAQDTDGGEFAVSEAGSPASVGSA